MKLEEIKAVAEARTTGYSLEVKTPGPNRDWELVADKDCSIAEFAYRGDAEFIAMCANHIDALIAIAEAAKNQPNLGCDCDGCFSRHEKIEQTIELLESKP